MTHAVQDAWRRRDLDSLGVWLHWASMGAALLFLLWVNRHQWFTLDEWDFLVRRGLLGSPERGLLEPHNEHWSAFPIVVYRALFAVFGVRTYLPYLVVLIGLHLVTVHLLWRLLLRIGAPTLVASCACAAFAVLGAGWENLTSAFQFSQIGSVTAGLAALLVVPERGPFSRRDALGWGLSVLALLFSGTGVTMVVVLGLAVLLRRGPGPAALTIAVPAALYLGWFATFGRDAEAPDQEHFTAALQAAPRFMWQGLVDTVDATTGFEGLGGAALLLLAVTLLRTARPPEAGWPVALATVAGAALFFFLVGLRRSGLGIETAGAPRYTYVAVALLIPAIALVAGRVLVRSALGLTLLASLTAVVLLVQVSELNDEARKAAHDEQEQKHRIVAAAEILAGDEEVIGGLPVPRFAPDLDIDDLAALDEAGKLPANVTITEEDRLTARAFLQVEMSDERLVDSTAQPLLTGVDEVLVEPGGRTGCVRVVPARDEAHVALLFDEPGAVRVRTERTGKLVVQVSAFEVDGRPRMFDVDDGEDNILSVATRGVTLVIEIPEGGGTTLCGVRPE